MRAHLLRAVAVVVGLQIVGMTSAAASTPVLVSDDDKAAVTVADDGTATVSFTFINSSPDEVDVTVHPGEGAADNCAVTAAPDSIMGSRQQKVTFTLTSDCDPERKDGTALDVTVGDESFPVTADPPATPSPDWSYLFGFVAAALIAIVILAIALGRWTPEKGSKSLGEPLPGLAPTWSFKDSWATNATVVTALFAGLFGTKDVTSSLLGDDATDVLALGVVSAAISVGLAGLAPMVLQALRTEVKADPEKKDGWDTVIPAGFYVTPRGLLAAALLTVAATGGQLIVTVMSLRSTDFGDDRVIVGLGIVAGILLCWYSITSTVQSLTGGERVPTEPADATTSTEVTHAVPIRNVAEGDSGPVVEVRTVVVNSGRAQAQRASAIL